MAEVVTGEAVVLEVPCARFPSRLLALAIDLAIQLAVIVILLGIVGASAASSGLDRAATSAIVLTVIVLTFVGYPVIWETTTRGRSPGKFALGLRVVSDDGGHERFRQALVRGLATVVDFWLLLGVPALISSLLSDKGKRLGDIFAGTFVVQHRLPARRAPATPPVASPELTAWASSLEMSGLSDQTAATARRYLGRLPELTPGPRDELGERIASAVRAQVSPPPPPGTPAVAYLSAVLAERHRREHARLAAQAAPEWASPAGTTQAWAPPAGTAPARAAPPAPAPASAWAAPVPAPAPASSWAAPEPAPAPASSWAAPEPPRALAGEWTRAAWEGERPQPVQHAQPDGPVPPREPAGSPAAGTGFVPPQ